MGAMLIGGVRHLEEAQKAADFLAKDADNAFLDKLGFGSVSIVSPKDFLEAMDGGEPWLVDYLRSNLGRLDLKMSGYGEEEIDGRVVSYEEVAERVVRVLERLNEEVEMMYYGGSCALAIHPETGEGNYFTVSQVRRMTKDGKLLTGKKSSNYKEIKEAIEKHRKKFSMPDSAREEFERRYLELENREDIHKERDGDGEIGGLFALRAETKKVAA